MPAKMGPKTEVHKQSCVRIGFGRFASKIICPFCTEAQECNLATSTFLLERYVACLSCHSKNVGDSPLNTYHNLLRLEK